MGGSLITDKEQPHTHRPAVLTRLADEIAAAWNNGLAGKIILGHGSGSFGHSAAKKYGTRSGVRSPADWKGFSEVWWEARSLNQYVVDAAAKAGLPAISFPPSAMVTSTGGTVKTWDTTLILTAVQNGLLPIINGDVIFDTQLGGTILSTEELFAALTRSAPPKRILLAGIEPGVWADYPACTRVFDTITPRTYPVIRSGILGSSAPDVTGGMLDKVENMLALIHKIPGLEVLIFSGTEPDNLTRALSGETVGTLIHAENGGVL